MKLFENSNFFIVFAETKEDQWVKFGEYSSEDVAITTARTIFQIFYCRTKVVKCAYTEVYTMG